MTKRKAKSNPTRGLPTVKPGQLFDYVNNQMTTIRVSHPILLVINRLVKDEKFRTAVLRLMK